MHPTRTPDAAALAPALTEDEMARVDTRVRLAPRVPLALRAAFEAALPAGAEVYLYGSRVDRNAAGGDIDLLVHVPGVSMAEDLQVERRLRAQIEARLGDRKVDLLFSPTLGPDAKPFVRLARHGAVRLYP